MLLAGAVGDVGSAFWLSQEALRAAFHHYQMHGSTGEDGLGRLLLRDLCLNGMKEVVEWSVGASKEEVARLAPAVFEAAGRGEKEAVEIVERGAERTAGYVGVAARRMGEGRPRVFLQGSVFLRQSVYVREFERRLKKVCPDAVVEVCRRAGAEGAALLALGRDVAIEEEEEVMEMEEMARALTEQRNPRSTDIDTMTPEELVEVFIREEDSIRKALPRAANLLGRAVRIVTASLRNGGRLFYVGAGTSGRLGMLDASEIPPTFGEPPETVQGIMAGGVRALYRSVEGAEDRPEDGAEAVVDRGVGPGDVVCGITASGRTPFVFGALERATEIGCKTILITCNENRVRRTECDVEIDIPTGPELITGSTRLKAGTATKICLNIITTGAMIQLGKVKSNLMVSLQATNTKLQDRASRLLAKERDWTYREARAALEASGWDLGALLETSTRGSRGSH
ncbi:unnamed protein product [Darwinula stevensoni]|uniref:N-acetyl-D-glucosamine kinase n=1 Tax=Darwinula stevensoni TaxID=69355 RepID=A0A7R9A1A8_9CRUS|nr:unnamed protein product [Darwinula stevensoni]CAG0887332.1 unnamed protein product [Darwinula stevensoni]